MPMMMKTIKNELTNKELFSKLLQRILIKILVRTLNYKSKVSKCIREKYFQDLQILNIELLIIIYNVIK